MLLHYWVCYQSLSACWLGLPNGYSELRLRKSAQILGYGCISLYAQYAVSAQHQQDVTDVTQYLRLGTTGQ